jgi:hypothetical protein
MDQTAFFACDDPSAMASYLPVYPPLQPAHGSVQPSPNMGGLVYPVTPTTPHGVFGMDLGISTQQDLLHQGRTGTAIDPYTNAGFVESNYNLMQVYDSSSTQESIKGDPDAPRGVDLRAVPTNIRLSTEQRLPTARRGPFKDNEQRQKTARTRKMGSCIRCRIQRIRVSRSTCRVLVFGRKVVRGELKDEAESTLPL